MGNGVGGDSGPALGSTLGVRLWVVSNNRGSCKARLAIWGRIRGDLGSIRVSI